MMFFTLKSKKLFITESMMGTRINTTVIKSAGITNADEKRMSPVDLFKENILLTDGFLTAGFFIFNQLSVMVARGTVQYRIKVD